MLFFKIKFNFFLEIAIHKRAVCVCMLLRVTHTSLCLKLGRHTKYTCKLFNSKSLCCSQTQGVINAGDVLDNLCNLFILLTLWHRLVHNKTPYCPV